MFGLKHSSLKRIFLYFHVSAKTCCRCLAAGCVYLFSSFKKRHSVKMETNIFVLIGMFLHLRLSKASVLTDKLKIVTDISAECPTTCQSYELSDNRNIQILETIDCGLTEARWDYKINVSLFSLKFNF
jgi:hypothetical protein